ncbi:MAG: ABC-2 family transporter protein [Patescibacteria group bacterium]
MKRYFQLYKAFLRFSFYNFTAFRANFINGTIATVAWGIFQIIWVNLLTLQTKSAFGWSKNELIILAILYVIIIGLLHFFFTGNFDRFSRIIDKGELDFILLKPVDSQFMVTNFIQRYPNLVRVVMGIAFLFVFLHISHTVITPAGWLGFTIFIIFGIVLLYSLWLFFCTFLIWFPRLTNIIEFLYAINGLSRFPAEMIQEARSFILLFILPFSIAIATPAKVLVRGTLNGEVYGLMFLSVGLFIASRIFWKYALRHYTSASS